MILRLVSLFAIFLPLSFLSQKGSLLVGIL
nr:MAG TPA: hypothetical protein [Caudoviricetes sp.]